MRQRSERWQTPSVTVAALFKFDTPAADQIRVVVETIGDVEKKVSNSFIGG
jgi:hypothetical protein